jgi:hypothetical protein
MFVEDRADLANAIALNSMMVNAARVIGPAVAGLLLAVTSEAVCFGINAASFLFVLFALTRIRWPAHVPPPSGAGWWPSFVEGARWAFGFAPARALLALVAIVSFTIVPYSSLMPIYAKVHFAGGPQTLGFLLACAGAGALIAMLWLAGRDSVRGLGRAIALAALASGTALALFSYMTLFPLALALMVPIGGGVTLAAASSNSILQTIVDDKLRGRIAGFYTLAFLGVAPLGHITAGAVAGAIGVQNAFLINGLACAPRRACCSCARCRACASTCSRSTGAWASCRTIDGGRGSRSLPRDRGRAGAAPASPRRSPARAARGSLARRAAPRRRASSSAA